MPLIQKLLFTSLGKTSSHVDIETKIYTKQWKSSKAFHARNCQEGESMPIKAGTISKIWEDAGKVYDTTLSWFH
jgi:hypothetical protein